MSRKKQIFRKIQPCSHLNVGAFAQQRAQSERFGQAEHGHARAGLVEEFDLLLHRLAAAAAKKRTLGRGRVHRRVEPDMKTKKLIVSNYITAIA